MFLHTSSNLRPSASLNCCATNTHHNTHTTTTPSLFLPRNHHPPHPPPSPHTLLPDPHPHPPPPNPPFTSHFRFAPHHHHKHQNHHVKRCLTSSSPNCVHAYCTARHLQLKCTPTLFRPWFHQVGVSPSRRPTSLYPPVPCQPSFHCEHLFLIHEFAQCIPKAFSSQVGQKTLHSSSSGGPTPCRVHDVAQLSHQERQTFAVVSLEEKQPNSTIAFDDLWFWLKPTEFLKHIEEHGDVSPHVRHVAVTCEQEHFPPMSCETEATSQQTCSTKFARQCVCSREKPTRRVLATRSTAHLQSVMGTITMLSLQLTQHTAPAAQPQESVGGQLTENRHSNKHLCTCLVPFGQAFPKADAKMGAFFVCSSARLRALHIALVSRSQGP